MAAMNLSVSVMATKHPTLVQVWIDCRSAVPLSTLTKTGSVRLRPSGSVITIAPVLPSAAGRISANRAAIVAAHLPAAEAWRLAGIGGRLLDCAAMGRRAVGGPFKACLALV